MNVAIPSYTPSPRQTNFHRSLAFETLYGGAAGGGKTAALCGEAITSALEQGGTHVYIFRRTVKELKQSVYQEIMAQIADYQAVPDDKKAITITYNGAESVFKFSNGSFIQLAYLDNVADRYRYQSAEIHLLLIDELTHFLFDDYDYLKTRVRSKDKRRLRVMAATNPGNVGHGWVKDYFIQSNNAEIIRVPEQLWTDPDTGISRMFVPAKVDDHPNATFRDNYKRVLNAIKDEQLRRALLEGDWDVFEGQVFTEWDRKKHVVDTLPIDLSLCKRYVGFDWGFNDWGCATWFAVAPESQNGVKHIYAYREIYDRLKTPQWWAREIAGIIKEEPIEYMVLPHDCFSHLGGNQTIARTFADYDIPYVRADSMSHAAKMHRIALMHQLLADSDDGTPYLQYHRNCMNNIRTIPDLPYSETKPEEISERAEDHAFDSSTYGLMVITDSEGWIVNSDSSKPKRRESFIISEEGIAEGLNLNIGKAIEESSRDYRDWRHY